MMWTKLKTPSVRQMNLVFNSGLSFLKTETIKIYNPLQPGAIFTAENAFNDNKK